jgi:uncharacterized membrane protein
MAWLHLLEMNLAAVVGVLKLILEAVAVLCVAAGLAVTASLALTTFGRRDRSLAFTTLRPRFGTWLALALEFQLAADILATTITPSTEALVQLGAIAAIRTFLNYFLQKELAAEAHLAHTPLQAPEQRSRTAIEDNER